MKNIKGNIFNIQRYSIDDGDGIRTCIFFKGCPLNCQWCHNPESLKKEYDLFFNSEKCIMCGACKNVCKNNVHKFENGNHLLERRLCDMCGKCAEECCSNALEICGKEVSAQQVIKEVIADNEFFTTSGGGITLTGGEPLFQPEFAIEIAMLAKRENINVAVETSGFADSRKLLELSKYTDCFLYDIKLFDNELHKKYTGVSNKIIFENLNTLYQNKNKIVLRCPIIPNVNMDIGYFKELKELVLKMPDISEVCLEPYHPLGISKSVGIGRKQKYANAEFLNNNELKIYTEFLKNDFVPVTIN